MDKKCIKLTGAISSRWRGLSDTCKFYVALTVVLCFLVYTVVSAAASKIEHSKHNASAFTGATKPGAGLIASGGWDQ